VQICAVVDHLFTHRRVVAQHRPRLLAVPLRHAALEDDQVVGYAIAAALDAEHMGGVFRAGPADGGEHVQLRRVHDHHGLAGGLLQLCQGLVGRGKEFAAATSGGLWYRWPRIPVQAGSG
jgi:hypothetical protein